MPWTEVAVLHHILHHAIRDRQQRVTVKGIRGRCRDGRETHVLPLIGDVGVSREVHAVMLQAFEGHYRLAGKSFGMVDGESELGSAAMGIANLQLLRGLRHSLGHNLRRKDVEGGLFDLLLDTSDMLFRPIRIRL